MKQKQRIQSDPFTKKGKTLPQTLIDFTGECWLVGGALRDAALGLDFSDLDLVLPPCSNFEKKVFRLAAQLNAVAFEMDAENSVWRITGKGETPFQIDILPFQGNSIEEDIRRRDFTVNALALKLDKDTPLYYNPGRNTFSLRFQPEHITDLCHGLDDIRKKRISAVSEDVFSSDPLRMLRAFRIAAEHGFKISVKTLNLIKQNAALVKNSAGERVRDELMKILNRNDSCFWIKKIHAAGLLFEIFPELKAQPECAVDYYGAGGVLRHTFAVLDRTDLFFSGIKEFCPHHNLLSKHINTDKPAVFKMAALLHDIAKPAKAAFIDGRLRFFGHEECGAIIAEEILKRLHFPKDEIRMVSSVIGSHLRPGNLAVNEIISERAMFRLFRAMGSNTLPLLVLCWADYASYITPHRLESMKERLGGPPDDIDVTKLPYNSYKKTLRFLQVIYKLAAAFMEKGPDIHGRLFADGSDVMKILEIQPGPEVGKILELLRLRQFEGKIKSREDALEWLRKQAVKR